MFKKPDDVYREINSPYAAHDYQPEAEQPTGWPKWVTILVGVLCAAAGVIITYFATKASGSSYDRTKPYVVPLMYTANLQFRIPYINFTEPFVAHVDQARGAMRLDYYGGMDTYIFDTVSNVSTSIVPVYTTPTCLYGSQPGLTLQNLFPDLTKFKLDKQEIITIPIGTSAPSASPAHPVTEDETHVCDVWIYEAGNKGSDANSTWVEPDAEGYAGVYKFYVDTTTGHPVAFHARGHNVVVGGSHNDEYMLVYLSIQPLSEHVPESMFHAPAGMPCHANDQPFGPTHTAGGAQGRVNPLDELKTLFPSTEGGQQRTDNFAAWAEAHGKTYGSDRERVTREQVFHSNSRYIAAANRRALTYSLRANHMADMTNDERRVFNGYVRPTTESLATGATLANSQTLPMDPMGACSVYQSSGKALPEKVDWFAGGLVLPPKDQGTCGSCWTYGTTGAIEGQWAKKTGKLVSLSQQNMMDCTWAYSNNACGGGSDYLAYAWILQQNSGSIADAESYGQYLNQDGFCHYAVNDPSAGTTNPFTHEPVQQGAKITGCQHVTPFWNATDSSVPPPADQANALLNDALANTGPVSVAIDATMEDFYFYHKGYFYNAGCGADLNSLDHIVLATGYTTIGGQKYTRIRNSWSTHWGEEGFAWISQKDNCCGVGTQPSIVTV